MKILFLGEHKSLYKDLAKWFNNDPSYGIEIYQKTKGDETPYEPDIIMCIYCQDSRDGYWQGISYANNPKKVMYGTWTDRMLDVAYLEYDRFASMAWQRSYHVPQDKFSLLPLPIDISIIPNSNLDASRSLKVIQSFMPMSHNKIAWLVKDICAKEGIAYEQVIGLAKQDAFTKVSTDAKVIVDQAWAGEIGMVSWEAMAMGIPSILWVSPDTITEFTKVFGSFPPLINLDIDSLTKTMTVKEREAIVRPVLTQCLKDIKTSVIDLVSVGQASRQWMLDNYNKKKIMDIYADFFKSL